MALAQDYFREPINNGNNILRMRNTWICGDRPKIAEQSLLQANGSNKAPTQQRQQPRVERTSGEEP